MSLDKIANKADKRSVLLVAAIASFLTPYTGSAINLALPAIGREMEIDAVLLGWVATVYLLSSAVFLVPFGRLSDIFGRRKIFLSGMVIFSVSSALCAFAGNISMLLIFRTFQGAGSAMIFATGFAILTSVFAQKERGRAMGVAIAAVYAGLSLGPVTGGILTEYLGWRSIFLVTVIPGAVSIFFVLSKIKKEWADAKGEPFDITGSLIYGVSLFLIIFGLSDLPSLRGIIFVFAGFSAFSFFVYIENRKDFPVMNIHLFTGNRLFALSNLAAFIHYSSTFAVAFLLSLFLQSVKGFSPGDAGLIMVSQPVVMALVAPLSGRLSDRFEPRYLSSAGMAVTATSLAFFIFLEHMSIWIIMSNLLLLGAGLGLFISPNTNAIMSSVEKRYVGIASGSMGTMRLLGQMFSMGMVMLIFSLFIGREEITQGNTQEFLETLPLLFTILSVLCFTGIFASYARGNIRINM